MSRSVGFGDRRVAFRKGLTGNMVGVVIGAGVLILAGGVLAASARLASYVMTGTRQTLEEAMAWQSDHYDTSFYNNLEKEDYTVPGYKGYLLHVQELRNPRQTDKYIILSHGYTDNHIGSLKYVPLYLDLGYHCIVYDLRGHGENAETFTTYGILEAQDLVRLIEDTRERHPEMTELGLHGESLGAATSITALKYHPDVNFVVADCGFSDIENVIRGGYRNAGLPEFLVNFADVGARVRYLCSIKHMRPIDALDGNQIPVLFIHGADDTFILPRNSQDMYDRTAGLREIRLIPGAGHAESVLKAPWDYRAAVAEFLNKIPRP